MFVLGVTACQSDQKSLLCRKWKTVALVNNTMERQLKEMEVYIDTLGDQDPELRQSIDLDSVKRSLKYVMDQSVGEQQLALEHTLMEFLPNGVAYTTSIDGKDSAMYTLEDKSIKLDEAKLKGFGETMTFDILMLSQDSLKLRLVDYGDTSIVSMIPSQG